MNIDTKQVLSVYSGKANECYCGCMGNHRYASAYRELGGLKRGYPVEDAEVSDRSVKLIVNKVLQALKHQDLVTMQNDELVSCIVGNRVYIVYFVTPALL